jgi:hypothetical protein
MIIIRTAEINCVLVWEFLFPQFAFGTTFASILAYAGLDRLLLKPLDRERLRELLDTASGPDTNPLAA